MSGQVQSVSFTLGAVEGLLDGVEPAMFGGEQRRTRAGVPLWRVVVSMREPGEIRRRSVDVLVGAPEMPLAGLTDIKVALSSPTISVWRTAEARSGFTVKAAGVEEIGAVDGGTRLPTAPSRGQR